MPTFISHSTPSGVSGYTHYSPSQEFDILMEFEYPSNWSLIEHINEVGILTLFLGDARFETLATPSPDDFHPTPNDYGSVSIWIMPKKPGQTPDNELESHKKDYSEFYWMTVLRDYTIKIGGLDSNILEYQIHPGDGYPSLMFNRRIYFLLNDHVYEIIYTVAQKDRGGEFDQGFDYFLSTIRFTH